MSATMTRQQYQAILQAHQAFKDALRGKDQGASPIPAMRSHENLIGLLHDAGIPTDGWVAS